MSVGEMDFSKSNEHWIFGAKIGLHEIMRVNKIGKSK